MNRSLPTGKNLPGIREIALSIWLVLLLVPGVRGAESGESEASPTPVKGLANKEASPSPAPKGNAGEKKGEPSFLSIGKGFRVRIYGHLRFDGSWDDAETNAGNTAMWVKRDQDKEEANLTCRHTRVGIDLEGPKTFGVAPKGKIEIDFYGKGSNSEVMQNLRLRHAYVEFDLGAGFSLLGGQTFDAHGTLFMRTLNTAVGWNHGNLCFRRPQIRLF